MKYDFSRVERRGTYCDKFDLAERKGFKKDCLSYWVADMDFKTAPEILQAMHERVDHGVFGYSIMSQSYFDAVAAWQKNHYGYEVKREWLIESPGIVFVLNLAIHAFTQKGDGVLIQRPVYYPFSNAINTNERKLVNSPLVWNGKKFEIDFDDFAKKIVSENVKFFFLCNPHNPSGRSWTKSELEKIAEICLRHNVLVLSDEIHSDFVWEPNHHTVFASLSPEVEKITITCTSPSKSFNLAGLQISNIFIADRTLRKAFDLARDKTGYDEPTLMGLCACEAAYTKGEPWLNELKQVIQKHIKDASDYIEKKSNGKLVCLNLEATYLLWIDAHNSGLTDKELNKRIRDAGVWLDEGTIFGPEGELFERINVATSWDYLEQGLERICKVVKVV